MKMLLMPAAVAVILSSVTTAQAPQERAQRDQTRAEAQQRADLMFGMLDANKDGTVTKAEAQAALAQFQSARGGDDGRGTGRFGRMIDQAFATAPSMSLAQFEAQALSRFDATDLDRNGTVTAAERAQVRAQRQAQ